MTRYQKHSQQLDKVHRFLHRHGCCDIHRMPFNRPHDFECTTVNGLLRVTVRVAHPRVRDHIVRVIGKRYSYRYPSWHFNFHIHGNVEDRYTDLFVLVALPRSNDPGGIFVVPWAAVTGKTFSTHNLRGYSGQYAPYRDAWHLLARRPSLRRVA